LTLANNSVRRFGKARRTFTPPVIPELCCFKDGKFAAAERRQLLNGHRRSGLDRSGKWRQLTAQRRAIADMGQSENLEWTNDGFNIQGWLLSPREVEARQEISMVVLIHGGPSSAVDAGMAASFGMSRAIIAALSSRGYYVRMPKSRGSYGRVKSSHART